MPSRNRLAVLRIDAGRLALWAAPSAPRAARGSRASLTAAEIYEQVMHVRDDFGERVTSVVLMGQGEPFMNYDATLAALRRLNSPEGAGIGARHLTVSTCGVIPQIMRFANEPEQFTLAVSLHSAVQKTRNALMPGGAQVLPCEPLQRDGRVRPTRPGGAPPTSTRLIRRCQRHRERASGALRLLRGNARAREPHSAEPRSRAHKLRPSTQTRAEDFVRALARVGVEATVRKLARR